MFVFLAVFVLRLLVLVRLTSSQFLLPTSGDMQFYNSWALRILHGDWTAHTAFYGLPLYAYLLAGCYKIVGYSPFVPGLIQAVLEGGTGVLLYKIGSCVFKTDNPQTLPARGKIIGLLAAAGWAFFQPAEAYSIILMPTAGLVFVFWFLVWVIVRQNNSPSLRGTLLLGGLIGFTAMGIATILFLIPLLLAAFFWHWPNEKRRRLSLAALLLAGVFIGTAPAWIHNYFVARDPVFLSAHSGVNFWIGNNPLANGYPKFPPGLHAGQEAMLQDSITTAEKTVGRPLKRAEVSSFWSAKALNWIRQNPAAWLQLLGVKIKNFWNAFQYDDLSIVTSLRDQDVIFPGISFGLIAALALPGLLIACLRFPGARWVAAAVLLHMASLLTVFVTERYRLAAVPGLLLFAAFGLWELWQNIARRQLGMTALFLILLFGATGFVSLPQKDPTLWALDTYNSGLQALNDGNLKLARRKLNRAYQYSPLNAEINFAEGNLHLALGDAAAAKRFYWITLHLDPAHTGALNNLGLLALEENRWSLAIHFLRRAAIDAPNDAKIHYLIACAAFGSGDLVAASNAISTAVKLDPTRPEFTRLQDKIAATEQTAATR